MRRILAPREGADVTIVELKPDAAAHAACTAR
jgi:hypothetical protein